MKKIFCILILSLAVVYPNFCIDPPLVDTLENEYIIIGSFIIHMSQVTEDNFKAASLTITDTQKIYYKSKFADGTWFRVDEGVEIKDVILKGNSETMKSDYMDSYFKFTLMIDPDGNLIKFGDDGPLSSSNPQIVTLDDLIKEKDDQILKMMIQVKGDINDASNEAIVSEIAQLNYDKSLFENFDDKTTIKRQAIKDKLAEIKKAKEENNVKLEYELYNELEELDEATFNKDSKLELLLTSLEDLESLNDLKAKFIANGFEKLVEELEIVLASKKEVVDDLSSKIITQNAKDLLSEALSEEEKNDVIAINSLISKRMSEADKNSSGEFGLATLNIVIESIMDDLASSLINSEAGINLKTGESLIVDLLKAETSMSAKLKAILNDAGGDIESKIQVDSLTIDLIKNKQETLLEDLKSNLSKVDKFYEDILSENFDSKTKILLELDKSNELLIAKVDKLDKLEKLKSNDESLAYVEKQISILTANLQLDKLEETLMISKNIIMLEKNKLDINASKTDSIKDLAIEVSNAVKSADKKELLADDRLNDSITGFNLSADIDNLSSYSDDIVAMLNRKYEDDMLKLLKERYYLIKNYNSDKNKIYNENLLLYTNRIKEIDLELHKYSNLKFVDNQLTNMRYNYWIAVISRSFGDQTKYLNIINEYKTLDQKLIIEEELNKVNLEEFRRKLKKLEGDIN
ncbi:MAG: hypothetical protein WBA54_07620 [Acidaminobacteraceae bacterium]